MVYLNWSSFLSNMETFLKPITILNRFQSEVYLLDPQGNFSIEKNTLFAFPSFAFNHIN